MVALTNHLLTYLLTITCTRVPGLILVSM